MNTKNIKCKLGLLFLNLVILMWIIIVTPTNTNAATRKCYTILSETTKTFSDANLTKPYGEIWANDEITVLEVHDKYSRVNYPVSGGTTKTAYIATSSILTATSGQNVIAKKEIPTFKRPNGSSYGHIDKNDQVLVLGASGNYIQVKYPVPGGHKYAFVTISDAYNYLL